MQPNPTHVPVMLKEAVTMLKVKPNTWYIDATFGQGGHSKQLLTQGAKVVGLDHDQQAIENAKIHFKTELENESLILLHLNFAQIDQVKKTNLNIQGILFDFGTNMAQLTSQERGFSLHGDGPLDMRMDTRLGVTAADLLNSLPAQHLATIFKDWGGEERSKKIAQVIVAQRAKKPWQTTAELARLIEKIKPRTGKLHPATKVFQALRIAVNTELENIEQALPKAWQLLQPGGHLVTISFHEGEDRLVKKYFKTLLKTNQTTLLTPKPITPSSTEITTNPAARSAKLRAAQKNV